MSTWNRGDLPASELAVVRPFSSVDSGTGRSGDRDPLAAVLSLGDRAARGGLIVGILLALLTHGAGAARAMLSLRDMWLTVQTMRGELHEYFWTMYDIDLPAPEKPAQKEPDPPPPPEPEPEPVAAPKPAAPPPEADPYEPPPAPAQATKVLTAPEDPSQEKIEDLTDQGFVSGDGTGLGVGRVSALGTASAPTWNPNAKVGGTPGGTGTGEPRPPPGPPKPDLSKSPSIVGSTNWNCPFPPEADAEQIDHAVAVVVVTVRPDGTPQSVKVVTDPGYGFGRSARLCALSKRYSPGLDRDGAPVTKTMPPIRVSFVR